MAHLRPLGRTGLMVAPIGLGTVKIGRTQGVIYPQPFDLPDDDGVRSLLDAASHCGVNLIDTAPAYGTSEERLGRLLPGPRDHWVIITKCGEEFSDGQARFDFSAAATRASVERSLRRLATDYLDVVLIHSDGRDEHILTREGALGELTELKRRGLVRAVGISTKTPAGGLLATQLCDVVMITLNPRARADEVVAVAAENAGAGILVKKALLSGHLTDPALGSDPVRGCLDSVLGTAGVSSAIIGTLSPAHLRQAVAAAESVLDGRDRSPS